MKTGAYYWDGWYAKIPHWTDRLMEEFADREPVWGWLGATVENMEMQIDYAADAGLKYFAFDWYYPENGQISGMNDAVDRFLKARNSERMEFCLLVANHKGGYIYRERWEDACRMFMPYLTDRRALKVDGKPVIIFFSSNDLSRCLGGEEETRVCLDSLRALVREAGLPGAAIVGCQSPPRDAAGDLDTDAAKWRAMCGRRKAEGLDALTGYNYHRSFILCGDRKTFIYPYEELARDHEVSWDCFARYSELPYMPIIIGGWDCRPWETIWEGRSEPHPRSCYSPDKTPPQLYRHMVKASEWISANKCTTGDHTNVTFASDNTHVAVAGNYAHLAETDSTGGIRLVNGIVEAHSGAAGAISAIAGAANAASGATSAATGAANAAASATSAAAGKCISFGDLAVIYAWNENGEGGYIEPTAGDGGRILNAVKQAIADTAD